MGNYWRQGEHWGADEYEDAQPNQEVLRRIAADEAERQLLHQIHLAREIGTLVKCALPFAVLLLLIWWPW